MKLVIDGSSLEKQLTGIGYNLLGLLQNLPIDGGEYTLVVREATAHPIPQHIQVVIMPQVPKWRGGGVWWYFKLGQLARRRRAITLFNTLNLGPLFAPQSVAIIHDVAPLTNPKSVSLMFRLRYKLTLAVAVHKAKGIVAVSQRTKAALQKIFPRQLVRVPVSVLPNGLNAWVFNPAPETTPTELKVRKVQAPFWLSVGTIQPRKNYATAVEAFAKFAATYPDWQYVIVGKWGWDYADVKQAVEQHPNLKGRLIFTGHLPEEALAWVYANAHGLILVSVEEGYGMPVLEAYAKGLPMLLSDIAVFREVAPADAVKVFVPVDDMAEMCAGMRQLVGSKHYIPNAQTVSSHKWSEISIQLLDFLAQVTI